MKKKILDVKDLTVKFKKKADSMAVVEDVSFSIDEGEILGVVGESGSGKSITSLSILGLLPSPYGFIDKGSIHFKGNDLTKISKKEYRRIRGKEIAIIFQEPMTSLNPAFTIGNQVMEPLLIHEGLSKKEARKKAIELLKLVEIPRAEEIVDSYPHQLSGGMRQRVMIAIALSCNPEILIADEPTTALDVTIQAQVLEIMKKLIEKYNTGVILISHDLGVIAEMCDRVVVMYAGKVVEEGPTVEIFRNPQHPYTKGLLKSIPSLKDKKERLYTIEGNVPTPDNMPKGCRFAPRCEFAFEKCWESIPSPTEIKDGHKSSCFLNTKELITQ
jgi:peptide/nickel transport system ATP-binding protein